MAGKTKNMSQIKQLLLLHKQGKGKKTIARILGISKNTVKDYLQKLETLVNAGDGLAIDGLVKLEGPVLEAKFHSGNPAYKEEKRYDYFKKQIPYFLKELKRKGVTRHLLWQEYHGQQTDAYSYSQFCFHLQQQLIAANPSMVLEHKPGDKLFIDYAGSKLYYTDQDTGEIIACEVFVACLPFSDYCFVMALPSQKIPDFLYGLECCLISLGGVPAALVPDNFKSAVIKASRYEPAINRALDDFANHYGTTVIPARSKSPKDKALVENQVKLIYSRVYAKLRNMQFFDLDSLNKAIAQKVREHNQTRMQQKPYCREERFISEEKKTSAAAPRKPLRTQVLQTA
jgi:transposase